LKHKNGGKEIIKYPEYKITSRSKTVQKRIGNSYLQHSISTAKLNQKTGHFTQRTRPKQEVLPQVVKRKPPIAHVFSLKKARKYKLKEWKKVLNNQSKTRQ